jgi:hypothetical protein
VSYVQPFELEIIKNKVFKKAKDLENNEIVHLETITPKSVGYRYRELELLEKYNVEIKDRWDMENIFSLTTDLILEIEKEINNKFLSLNWFEEIGDKINKGIYILVNYSKEGDIAVFMVEVKKLFELLK